MRNKNLLFSGLMFLVSFTIFAQQKTSLKLHDAINLAITKSSEVVLANTKANTKKFEVQTIKNNLYPNLKASGQFQKLANASVNLKINNSVTNPNEGQPAAPKVNQLVIGQLNASMPVFAGFKLKNSIQLSENLYQSENAMAENTKEEVAIKVVEYYAELYKAQKSITLLEENIVRANQRVTDFKAMEENGIIARNDLLKAQLQVSKVQLSLDETNKNVSIINYYLITLLKLPAETKIFVDENEFKDFIIANVPKNEEEALQNRKDLKAIEFQKKATKANIKIAQSDYFPSLSLIGGYTFLDLQNVITVKNAMSFGVGIAYDLTSIFKNGNQVKVAKSKALEIEQTEILLTDNIKIQVQQAIENYNLAVKQEVVYEQAVAQSSENYRIIKDKYDNGLSDTNDLLEADVEQLNSKINQAYTKANTIEKYYQLLSVSGQLTASFNLIKK